MFVEQLETLNSDQIFENFELLTRLRYDPYEEHEKTYATTRNLNKAFEEFSEAK